METIPRTSEPTRGLGAWLMPGGASVLLMLAIHVGLALSCVTGHVSGWLPHFDGNCSVSKACRGVPALHAFRALALPSATLLALTWWIAGEWLRERELVSARVCRWIVWLGCAGALFLVLYGTFLGTQGRTYGWLRRYGIYVFFGGTSVAQLLVTVALTRAGGARLPELEGWVLRALQATILFMLAAGPINLVAAKVAAHESIANVLEWWFGIAMAGVCALLARVWRRAGLTLRLGTAGRD